MVFAKLFSIWNVKKDSHFVVNCDFHWVCIAFFLWVVNCENINLLPVKCHLEPRLPPSSVFIVLCVQLRPFAPWNIVIVITGHLPYLMAKTLHDSGSFCPGGWGGGTLGLFGWGCAAGTLEPLAYTRASSRVAVFQKQLRSLGQSSQNKTPI